MINLVIEDVKMFVGDKEYTVVLDALENKGYYYYDQDELSNEDEKLLTIHKQVTDKIRNSLRKKSISFSEDEIDYLKDIVQLYIDNNAEEVESRILNKFILKLNRVNLREQEETEEDLYNKYVDLSIPSRFDKWISMDFGDVPSHIDNSVDYKGEVWNFAGRQKDRTYAFVRNKPRPQKVLFTKTFYEVAKYIALPGRKY